MNEYQLIAVPLVGVVLATSICEAGKSEHCDAEKFSAENICQTRVPAVTGSYYGSWAQLGMNFSQSQDWQYLYPTI